ncbi:hypothetical protein DDZ16_09590 [Marinilabilia rubra]|uniref:DUF4377 domain-containing protein n=2 Tax=Marinilabilia rubra TaxID=2162893 RepID=A0A2U2B9F6_9BACT|nr:hypothetical protein DDZ16_09590 [Marinilabilia rubra]
MTMNMKRKVLFFVAAIIAFVFASCGKEKNNEEPGYVKMRINHYQQPVNNEEYFKGLAYLIQEGEEIGSEIWHPLLNTISGFDYELGYVYEIAVIKNEIDETLIDNPGVEYACERVISKTRAPENATFQLTIAINYTNGFESLVEKNEESHYTLMGETVIEAGEFYNTLEESIENQHGLRGTFSHMDDQSICLVGLEVFGE